MTDDCCEFSCPSSCFPGSVFFAPVVSIVEVVVGAITVLSVSSSAGRRLVSVGLEA